MPMSSHSHNPNDRELKTFRRLTENERVRELIDHWEQLRQLGTALSVEELCSDCPELVDEVREWVSALKATDWLCEAEPESVIAAAVEPGKPPEGSQTACGASQRQSLP